MTTARLTGPNPDRSQARRGFESFDRGSAPRATASSPADRTCRRHRFAAARLWLRDAVRVYLY